MIGLVRLHRISYSKIFLYASSSFKCHTQSQLHQSPTKVFTTLQKIRKNLDYQKIISPEYFNFSSDIIDSWANIDQKEKDKPCAYWFVYKNGQEVKWTFEQLSKNSKKSANALLQLGSGAKWKKCMLLLPKMPEWWLINLALMRVGNIVIHSTSMITPKDIEYRLQATKAQCIITTPALAEAVDTIASKCPSLNTKIVVNSSGKINRSGWLSYTDEYSNASEEHECVKSKGSDPFQIYFTSGTTHLPKQVLHSHSGFCLDYVLRFLFCPLPQCREATKDFINLDRRVVYWCLADTGWAKTMWGCVSFSWLSGATTFVHEMPQFNPQQTIEILHKYPIQRFCAPPTVYRMLIANEIPKFDKLEVCVSGGEAMQPEVIKKWKKKTNITILEAYGQTETSVLIYNSKRFPFKMGSMGKANPSLKIDLLDEDGKEVPRGKVGQIAVKVKPNWPLGIFKGYEEDAEKTSKVFVGDYYLTGDHAYVDADGYFFYTGRKDDLITSSAYRIGPVEVESALQQHPDVLESAVIGVPDFERTQIVKAFVILKDSGKKKDAEKLKKELQEHVKKTTAPYKYPRQIEFIDVLPKTISQKIKRAELRAAEEKKFSTNPVQKK
uniref:medium-chain acyl-CoA ligase n=1 Tax=Strigamia maritima TaxID=126957 RepID=T1JBL1_STRMM